MVSIVKYLAHLICMYYIALSQMSQLYSIILPTYNERENLPICIWLINQYLVAAKINFEVGGRFCW